MRMRPAPESLDSSPESSVVSLESRPFRAFRSSEEYLLAMKEDLAEWLNALYSLDIHVDLFMERLETGVTLCRSVPNLVTVLSSCPMSW